MIDILKEKNKSLTSDVDELEQYFRRNCLLLHGFNKKKRKIICTGHTRLVIETRKMVSHELLLSSFPAIVIRNKIYSNKKKLKGKNFLITKSLTS